MLFITRKSGSQRASKPLKLEIQNYNTAGQGGDADIVLIDPETQMYYVLRLESDDEGREMLSAVAKARNHT